MDINPEQGRMALAYIVIAQLFFLRMASRRFRFWTDFIIHLPTLIVMYPFVKLWQGMKWLVRRMYRVETIPRPRG